MLVMETSPRIFSIFSLCLSIIPLSDENLDLAKFIRNTLLPPLNNEQRFSQINTNETILRFGFAFGSSQSKSLRELRSLFQPAEEGARGLFMAAGCISEVKIVGVGGHAAFSQQTVDPLVPSLLTILAVQQLVSREIDDPLHCQVCATLNLYFYKIYP
ncbi:hypothetical protein TSUD_303200 [Trifolium subterraneum]|uniref:Peptidase M20 dimerisation domain-containing protein n=1 Tax=Trifolium subterraneum TaxID=3900 RepID=A0A2Z6PQZ1_TRISU|nr:hypothetical protein TSUD_303200 [Trifolium subterraneum]